MYRNCYSADLIERGGCNLKEETFIKPLKIVFMTFKKYCSYAFNQDKSAAEIPFPLNIYANKYLNIFLH